MTIEVTFEINNQQELDYILFYIAQCAEYNSQIKHICICGAETITKLPEEITRESAIAAADKDEKFCNEHFKHNITASVV